MKKKFVTTILALTVMATMLVGCGSQDATTGTTNDAEITSEMDEPTQVVTETETETEVESTNNDTETESTDVSATGGSEFTNIAFDENEVPYFVNADENSYQNSICSNNNYYLEVSGTTNYQGSGYVANGAGTDLESIVASMQKDWDSYKASSSGSSFQLMENTYEIVTIGDYTLIKTTTDVAADEEAGWPASTRVFYELPLQYNGEYVHNNVFSTVGIYPCAGANIDETGSITEQGVLEALELLY